jgi:hypothetical protein
MLFRQSNLTDKLNGKYSIPTRVDNPFPVNYDPSTDLSDILDPECSSFYQHLIGVMRWMVDIGRIDIATEVSMLSSYLAYPREGHLENALHVMGYLQLKHNSQLIFDPIYLLNVSSTTELTFNNTLTLTKLPFHPLNGWSSMATWKKQFLPTCLLPLAKTLTFV